MASKPSFLSNIPMTKPWRFVIAAAALVMIYTTVTLYQHRTTSSIERKLPPPIPGAGMSLHRPENSAEGDRKETLTVDWSRFAYFQYITSDEHVCQAVLIFEALHRVGAKADKIVLYPREWQAELDDPANNSKRKELLVKVKKEYNVIWKPVEIQRMATADPTWAAGFTKLLNFNQTEYDRVLGLDSDANVLQPMDELFLMPSSPAAMPRAYWITDKPAWLSDQLWLVEPSHLEMKRIEDAKKEKKADEYDMEIMNKLYGNNCLIIPHRKYDLLSGEFKKKHDDHSLYLGNKEEVWDGKKVLAEAKFVHFSDWPLRKPWYKNSDQLFEQHQPKCVQNMKRSEDGNQLEKREDCTDRDIWRGLYSDYAKRRKNVCGLDLM